MLNSPPASASPASSSNRMVAAARGNPRPIRGKKPSRGPLPQALDLVARSDASLQHDVLSAPLKYGPTPAETADAFAPAKYASGMAFPQRALNSRRPADETVAGVATEWVGKQGDKEPDACAAMTTAERIEMVWPITVTAWAFAGKPCDESRLRRDVESFVRRRR